MTMTSVQTTSQTRMISSYQLRDYQKIAADCALKAFQRGRKNGLVIVPTGGGKSWIIAEIAYRLNSPLLVFCPSKEILEQNYEKMNRICPFDCSMYSASVRSKEISKITFATIGSVNNHVEDFNCFKYVIVDEAHAVNSESGMYLNFIRATNRVVVGFTATPYRLKSYGDFSVLKFLTRTQRRVFSEVIFKCQVRELVNKGYLARLNYYDVTSLDMSRVKSNSTGADYDESSLKEEYNRSGYYQKLSDLVNRLLRPKSGIPRKGILVFTRFVEEAQFLANTIPDCAIVTGDTPKRERERIISDFRAGKIKVVSNVNCLSIGFDYPELDTILIGRPTKSLALYYQIVGRALRPSEGKQGWIVDMCGNIRRFGKVEDLEVTEFPKKNNWCVMSNGKVLTNVPLV